MKKTDKKLDNQICKVLTHACETAKSQVDGFQWLTHLVNYNQFPESLLIICIFDTKTELEQAQQESQNLVIVSLIKNELKQINIRFNDRKSHVLFDTEEACEVQHNGNWQKRFKDISIN